MEATCDKPKYLSKDVGNTKRKREREGGKTDTSGKSLTGQHVMEIFQLQELAQGNILIEFRVLPPNLKLTMLCQKNKIV